MRKYHIVLVLGSAREGRHSEKVAKFVFQELSTRPDMEVEFVDVKDFLFGRTSEDGVFADTWKTIAKKADGFVIVSPEYNHSFPGELKILLDSIDDEFEKKPVALCGVSSGKLGGARMIDHIKPVLATLGMIQSNVGVNFSLVEEAFDEKGTIIDESYKKKVAKMADELGWFLEKFQSTK